MQIDHTTKRPEGFYSTWGAALVTACLGSIIVWLVITKKLNNYLQPYFLPWMAITGLALLGLSVWTAIGLIRTPEVVGEDSSLHTSAWFLTVPVILLVCVQPSPLGSAMLSTSVHSANAASAALRNAAYGGGGADALGGVQGGAGAQGSSGTHGGLTRNPDGTIAYPPLPKNPPGGFNTVTVEDLSQRFTFGNKMDLDNVPVQVIGFAAQGQDGQQLLGRYKIYCCAADALPFIVQLTDTENSPGEISLEKDQWYQVQGRVTITDTRPTQSNDSGSASGESGSATPEQGEPQYLVITVDTAEKITPPERPYL